VKNISILIEPYMPETSARLWNMLNLHHPTWDEASQYHGLDGHIIQKPSIIYHNLDAKQADIFHKKFSGQEEETPEPDPIPVPCVQVGKIVHVERHPDAERLYVVRVSLGESERQLVAGMVQHFTAEEMLNRHVLVVTNLKTAVIRGVESNGMILACEKGKKLDLFEVPAKPGIQIDWGQEIWPELSIDAFKAAKLRVKDHQLLQDETPAKLNGKVVTSNLANGKVR